MSDHTRFTEDVGAYLLGASEESRGARIDNEQHKRGR